MTTPFTLEIVSWAQAAQRVYQIPSSLALAAGWVESNLGAHTPPGTNNWFGIKDPSGVVASTQEQTAGGISYTIQAGFMVFKSPADGFMYYGHLLGLGKPYHDMVTKFLQSPRAPADVQALANALTGVYATALEYGSTLIAVMNQYDLYQYDALPSAAIPAQPTGQPPMTTTTSTPTLAPASVPPIVAPAPTAPSVKQTALNVGDALETLLKLADAAAEAGVPTAMSLLPGPLKFVTMFFAPTVIQGYVHTAFMQLEASAQGKTIEIDTTNSLVAMVVQALNSNEAWLVGQLENLEASVEPLVKAFLAGKTATEV